MARRLSPVFAASPWIAQSEGPLVRLAFVALATQLLQTVADDDWLAIVDFQTDAWCTTSHDLVSGAQVTDCVSAIPHGEAADQEQCGSPERFVSLELRQVGDVQLRVVECSNPNYDVERFKVDVGDEALESSCLLRSFVESFSVPPECDREYVFLTNDPADKRQPYRLVSCSAEQLERATAYVARVAAGEGPTPVEEPTDGAQPIPVERLHAISLGTPASSILAEFGPPDGVHPRYPDGVSLNYPVAGAGGFALVELSRTRRVLSVSRYCEAGGY